mgnify:FL=1
MIKTVNSVDVLQHGILAGPEVTAVAVSLPLEPMRLAWLLVELAVGVAAIVTMMRGCRTLRHTTLVAPLVWSGISLVLLLVADGTLAFNALRPGTEQAVRYLTAITVFCPFVSLLGSRRPHAQAWNFVVLSFFGIMALPALELVFVGRARYLDIHDARGWFLWLLVVLSTVNYLPTRHGFAGMLLVAGQFCLLGEYLPLVGDGWLHGVRAGGVPFLCGAVLAVRLRQPRPRSDSNLTDAWLYFRDTYGSLWALRIGEQFNAAARLNHWPVTVRWSGVQCAGDIAAVQATVSQALRNLLRRFLSPEWVQEVLEGSPGQGELHHKQRENESFLD